MSEAYNNHIFTVIVQPNGRAGFCRHADQHSCPKHYSGTIPPQCIWKVLFPMFDGAMLL